MQVLHTVLFSQLEEYFGNTLIQTVRIISQKFTPIQLHITNHDSTSTQRSLLHTLNTRQAATSKTEKKYAYYKSPALVKHQIYQITHLFAMTELHVDLYGICLCRGPKI